ncbi:hypothetical protein A9Q81_19700 [Gammaproteobacteria bacterium 42_54_T18]|nr:hypothetical protein A9Q81_19700 [Gammaproteobacteria bacterium 42_54_T18]
MAFTYLLRATLWLVAFTTIPTNPVFANSTSSHLASCNNSITPSCLLEKTLDLIQSLPTSHKKETILIELGFESYFLNNKYTFKKTMIEIEKTNQDLRKSYPSALKKLSSLINKNAQIIPNNLFSNAIAIQLAKEEIYLNSIKNKTMSTEFLINSTFNKKTFSDSLQWNAAYIYYLSLTRDVSLKKSTEIKRFLIKQLAQSPPEQHQQHNLEISLLETLGGALKQGEETRLISSINGFSPHHLVQLNQRILFYQQFTKFYNTKIGLHQDQCNDPLTTTSNSLNTFFSSQNLQIIKQLESLTAKEPNDYLLASIIIQHLNSCTPLSNLFQQRYLQSLENIPLTTDLAISSAKKVIQHLRSLRRYTKT